jgi:ankyrin repeat protein
MRITLMYTSGLRCMLHCRRFATTSLLDHGADTNYPDNYGLSPLHVMLRQEHGNLVRLLLEHGADPNHPDSDS